MKKNKNTPAKDTPAEAGLPTDSPLFKVLTEIQIISHLASNEFERLLPTGMTEAQFGVLNHLLRLDVQETVGELAAAFQVAQPTMSSTVKRLEEKGLILLVPSLEDRRVKRVHVTDTGKKTRDKIVLSLEPEYSAFLETAPDIRWTKVLPALTALRDYLEKRR